jgi:hypothetical protein
MRRALSHGDHAYLFLDCTVPQVLTGHQDQLGTAAVTLFVRTDGSGYGILRGVLAVLEPARFLLGFVSIHGRRDFSFLIVPLQAFEIDSTVALFLLQHPDAHFQPF